jgi:hypothetical protein
MKWVLLVCLVLIGCGQQPANDNHGLGFGFDEQGATGVRVRYLDDNSPRLSYVETQWTFTTECINQKTGFTYETPAPLVIFIPDSDFTEMGQQLDGTVTIEKQIVDSDIGIPGMRWTLAKVMHHEFIHWITRYHGLLTEDQQRTHASNLFFDCDGMPS